MEVDTLDIILVVRDSKNIQMNTADLVDSLNEFLEELKQSHSRLEPLQVIEIDTEGSVYHQIFAYRRARVVIGADESLLANCAWMSKRASVIDVSKIPVPCSTTPILGALLQLDYNALPSTAFEGEDKIAIELENIKKALTIILTKS